MKDFVLQVRVTEEEHALFTSLAAAQNVKLSAWVRSELLAAAGPKAIDIDINAEEPVEKAIASPDLKRAAAAVIPKYAACHHGRIAHECLACERERRR